MGLLSGSALGGDASFDWGRVSCGLFGERLVFGERLSRTWSRTSFSLQVRTAEVVSAVWIVPSLGGTVPWHMPPREPFPPGAGEAWISFGVGLVQLGASFVFALLGGGALGVRGVSKFPSLGARQGSLFSHKHNHTQPPPEEPLSGDLGEEDKVARRTAMFFIYVSYIYILY